MVTIISVLSSFQHSDTASWVTAKASPPLTKHNSIIPTGYVKNLHFKNPRWQAQKLKNCDLHYLLIYVKILWECSWSLPVGQLYLPTPVTSELTWTLCLLSSTGLAETTTLYHTHKNIKNNIVLKPWSLWVKTFATILLAVISPNDDQCAFHQKIQP